jgi:hypothetical protein
MAAVTPIVNENPDTRKGSRRGRTGRNWLGLRNVQSEPVGRRAAERSTFPHPDAETQILPAVPAAPQTEVIEHFSPSQLSPMPVLSAIGEDAARGTGGKISPQEASRLLHKHLAVLDWRLAQVRRGAVNQADVEADVANLTAADEAAQKVGGRVVVDSRAFVDKILKRADMRSNPEMHTQTFVAVSAATEFPAPVNGAGRPTIGEQLPAHKMGEGDFLLDVDDTGTLDPLSMWRLVEKVERLDDRVVAVFVDGRSLGFAPDEVVWLLPPLEGRRQRDAAGNGHAPPRPAIAEQPSPVHAEDAPVPAKLTAAAPLPQRRPQPVVSFPAVMVGEGEQAEAQGGGTVSAVELKGGVWLLDEDDHWSLIDAVTPSGSGKTVTIKLAGGLTMPNVPAGRQMRVLSASDAKDLLAEHEQSGGAA